MGHEYIAYAAYGFYFTGQEIRDRFGSLTDPEPDGDDEGWRYNIPGIDPNFEDPAHCVGEAVDQICCVIGKRLDLQVSYCEEGDYHSDTEMGFGYVIHLEKLCASDATDGLKLEDIMRAEEATCELGNALRELGLSVADWPRVFVVLNVG